MKKIFYLIKDFETCSYDLAFTQVFGSKLRKLLDGDLISGVW